jgi:hypothetical protein
MRRPARGAAGAGAAAGGGAPGPTPDLRRIESFLEMLAADEIAPEDTGALRATGFLVRNFKLLSREQWMQETVDHTTKAFLGVTLECARCHDHRYDPISQEEYYRVRAVFEPYQVRLDRLPGEPDIAKQGIARVFDAEPDAKTYLYERGDDRRGEGGAVAVERVGSAGRERGHELGVYGHLDARRANAVHTG